MAINPGTKLGPYEIQSALGAGGMGEVYRARDTRLERTVAIKILPEHLSSNAELKARFEREARTVSSLNHPHICQLYDIGSQDATAYLVMEYLDGETLADRLRKGPLPLKQALEFGMQITEALATAHHGGILHRDLKPASGHRRFCTASVRRPQALPHRAKRIQQFRACGFAGRKVDGLREQ